jgi:hypothetical protein
MTILTEWIPVSPYKNISIREQGESGEACDEIQAELGIGGKLLGEDTDTVKW